LDSNILTEKKGHVYIIRLNQPNNMNSLEKGLRTDLKEALTKFSNDSDGRVAILTGQGKAFCAGGSLVELKNGMNAIEGVNYMMDVAEIIQLITSIAKPIIAAVNGAAVGAGFNLALACDMIIASTNAVFSQAFARMGLVPDLGGLYFLPRVIGMHKAKELIFMSKTLKADEALQMGILNRVVATEELDSCVLDIAAKIAEGPAVAFGLGKIILSRSMEQNLRDVLQYEAFAQAVCMQTDDHKEGLKAFYEKRNPVFGGK
jgi:2-(1,2-epoxy-1,2-dihydrophenyl)acetyl-CoA isomerase